MSSHLTPSIAELHQLFVDFLYQQTWHGNPQSLYEPQMYMMQLGGKRIRPILCLAGAICAGLAPEAVLKEALALEVFHNFTLVHDDLMDAAPLRRGAETVHIKWNPSTAILSGDTMLVRAIEILADGSTVEAIRVLCRMAKEVCEGQQFDMEFEAGAPPSTKEYLQMIELKTGALLGAALQIGAMKSGNLNPSSINELVDFGRAVGVAFQLQDDYLDTFGAADAVGKLIGGDILAGKKTYPFLMALEALGQEEGENFNNVYGSNNADKIATVMAVFDGLGIKSSFEEMLEKRLADLTLALSHLEIQPEGKTVLREIMASLSGRKF